MTKRKTPTADANIVGPDLAFKIGLTPQTRMVFDYLNGGRTLTNQIALNNLGVSSVTSRVAELRKALKTAGDEMRVVDEWKKDFSKQRYKSYSLATRPAEGWSA